MAKSSESKDELEEGEISEDVEDIKSFQKNQIHQFRNEFYINSKPLHNKGYGRRTNFARFDHYDRFQSNVGRPYVERTINPRYRMSYRNRASKINAQPSIVENFPRDIEKNTSYLELLEQYRQIKSRLEDLNEEEVKRLDKNNTNDTRGKSPDTEIGNKENRHQKKSPTMSRKRKQSPVQSTVDSLGSSKGKCSKCSLKGAKRRKTSDSSDKLTDGHETHRNQKLKNEQENNNNFQRQCEEDKSDEDEDLLELRKQALATLSKQSTATENQKMEEHGKPNICGGDDNKDQFPSIPVQNFQNSLGDNYEEIEMELDSDLNPESPEKAESEDELDEELLRAQLLESLAGKRKSQQQKEMLPENVLLPVPTISKTENEITSKTVVPAEEVSRSSPCEILTTRPLVINLAEDSSSGESDNETKEHNENTSTSLPTEIIPASLEELLKQARKKSDKKTVSSKSANCKTPAAVYKLSQAQQLEYRKLKEEIAKREQVRKTELKEISVDNTAEIMKWSTKLTLEKLQMKKEQERIQILKSQLFRKKTAAHNTHRKIQELKKQLAAAERLMAGDLQIIKICNIQIKEVQTSLKKRMTDIEEVENRCRLLGKELDISNRSEQMQHQTKNTSIEENPTARKMNEINVLTNRPKAKMTGAEISMEKKRLQILEREITLKLQELRKKSQKTLISTKTLNQNHPSKINGLVTNNIPNLTKVFLPTKRTKKSKDETKNFQITKKLDGTILNGGNTEKLVSVSHVIKNKVNPVGKCDKLPAKAKYVESIKELHKLNKVLEYYAHIPVLLYSYQLYDIFRPELEKAETNFTCEKICDQNLSDTINYGAGCSYSSPLLHMNSYRLHPHFVSHESKCLSSSTYANGIDVKSRLCRFDLLGVCNDEQCTWQHSDQYKLNNCEIIADLLAYAPSLAGVESSDDITKYKEKLMKEAEKKLQKYNMLSLEEICRKVVAEINNSSSDGTHFTPLINRPWKFSWKKPKKTNVEESEVPTKISKEWKYQTLQECDLDNLITDADQRYFNIEEKGIDRLEAAIKENVHNIQLWLKLAYKYLYNSDSEHVLEQTLNVLSRALENNPHNPELWQHYLSLYAQHPSSGDIDGVFKEALELCPHYQIWWKYLQFSSGYQRKLEICREFLDYLISEDATKCITNKEVLSHYILEVLLYQAQLCLQAGNLEAALLIFKKLCKNQNEVINTEKKKEQEDKVVGADLKEESVCIGPNHVLQNSGNNDAKLCRENEMSASEDTIFNNETVDNRSYNSLFNLITEKDCCFVWLCYIYLVEFHSLPHLIFQNGPDCPSSLISKNLFLIDWTKCSKINSSKQTLKNILNEAVSFFRSRQGNFEDFYFPFYFQLVTLELQCKNYSTAIAICQQLREMSSNNCDAYLLIATVYKYQNLEEELNKTLEELVSVTSYDPRACYMASLYHFSKNNIDDAKLTLENCVQQFFVSQSSEIPLSAKLLYQKLLEHNSDKLFIFPKNTKVDIPESSRGYLWLNYILYLQCQRCSHSDIVIAYEAALASFHSATVLKVVWWQYIQYSTYYLSSKTKEFSSLSSLVSECIINAPINISLPHIPGKLRIDLDFQTTVLDFFLNRLSVSYEKALMAEKFLMLMPKNTGIIERIVYYYLISGKEDLALSIIEKNSHAELYSVHLWRMAICVLSMQKDQQEVHHMYNEAVQALPYTSSLWKEYMLYELSENHAEHVQVIREKCKKLQINYLQDQVEYNEN